MKNLYKGLLTIALVCFLYTISTILKESIDLTIPGVKATIEVEAWDKGEAPKVIYKKIKAYAQKNNLSIHKIVFSSDAAGEGEKNVFTFSAKDVSNYSYDTNALKTKTNFYDSEKLTTENVTGSYALTTAVPKNLKAEFASLGLIVSIEKLSIFHFIIGSLFTTIGLLSIILALGTIISGFFYKISQLKKYGIWEISGQAILTLAVRDFFFDVLIIIGLVGLFIFLNPLFIAYYLYIGLLSAAILLLFNLVGTLGINQLESNIEKIKGRKPYKPLFYVNTVLKVLVAVLFVVFSKETLAQMEQSKIIYQSLANWEQMGEYYHLNFSSTTTLLPTANTSEEELKKFSIQANKKLYPLLEQSEKKQGILSINNELSLNEYGRNISSYIGSQPFMTINHNFLNEVQVVDSSGKRIQQLSKEVFYCLIPENEKGNTEKIKEEIRELIPFYQDIFGDSEERYTGKLEVLYTQANQKIFNFNLENPEYSFSENPAILVVSLELIGDKMDYLIAEISQGHYLFANKTGVNQFISENDLENEFFGLISAKETGLEMLQKVRSEYKSKMISLVFLSCVFVLTQFFISLSYAEVNKKRLFLQYILGNHFFTRHGSYFGVMLLLSIVVLAGLTMINSAYFLLAAGVVIFELCLLLFTTIVSEKSVRVNIVKQDT